MQHTNSDQVLRNVEYIQKGQYADYVLTYTLIPQCNWQLKEAQLQLLKGKNNCNGSELQKGLGKQKKYIIFGKTFCFHKSCTNQ